jgi:hypothetical protein
VPVTLAELKPGDVIVTATPDLVGWWIRVRSWLSRRPDLHNHVAMFTHLDEQGKPRGLEGRPSGFGWANLEKYLDRPDTIANTRQPYRDDDHRAKIVELATTMIGIPYDWQGIIRFAGNTAGMPYLGKDWPEDGVPSHVVCSSAVDYLYEAMRWHNPGGYTKTRGTDPDDWTDFVEKGDATNWSDARPDE